MNNKSRISEKFNYKSETGEKGFLQSKTNFGKERLKSYYTKFITNHDFFKNEKNKIFQIRDTFLTSYNEHKDQEKHLLDLIVSHNFEISSLEAYVQSYQGLCSLNSNNSGNTLIKIKNALSMRKDQLLSSLLENKQINSKEHAEKLIDDIRKNHWDISEKNLQALYIITQK